MVAVQARKKKQRAIDHPFSDSRGDTMSREPEAAMDDVPDADQIIQDCLNLDHPKSFFLPHTLGLGHLSVDGGRGSILRGRELLLET